MSREIVIYDNLTRNDTKLTKSTIISSFDFASTDSDEFEKKFSILAKSCLKQNSKILVLPILEKCHKNVRRQLNMEKEHTVMLPNEKKESLKQTNSLYHDTSQLKNDWSSESNYLGSDYFARVETFLDTQLKQENEIKEKCQEIVRERNIKNSILDMEDKLREYDEQISLNLLLKKNKDYTAPQQHHHNSTNSLNLKDMRGPHCERCVEKNRKFEDSFLENLLSLDVAKRGKNKKKLTKLPVLSNSRQYRFQSNPKINRLANESRENISKSFSSFGKLFPSQRNRII